MSININLLLDIQYMTGGEGLHATTLTFRKLVPSIFKLLLYSVRFQQNTVKI